MTQALKALIKKSKAILATALLAGSAVAHAGFITIDYAGLQQIYDQANIQLRYNASQTIYNTDLLTIDDNAEFDALAGYQVGGSVLSMFFVDGINFCGAAVPGIVGCGGVPGTYVTLDSGFASTAPEAATATGHEIGHNLGLNHVDPAVSGVGDNLMNPETYVGNPAPLTPDQIAQIFTSPLVQFDGNQAFLSITPIAVLASLDVPEPGSMALVALSLVLLVRSRRTRRS